jgi:hypothetical protein
MIETDLDEQIAIRLFGHDPTAVCTGPVEEYCEAWPPSWSCRSCGEYWDEEPPETHLRCNVRSYSGWILGAWEVVDEMLERGFHVELKSTEDGWFCVMSSPPKGKWTELSWVEYMANGKTPAEAICQVALKALQND